MRGVSTTPRPTIACQESKEYLLFRHSLSGAPPATPGRIVNQLLRHRNATTAPRSAALVRASLNLQRPQRHAVPGEGAA